MLTGCVEGNLLPNWLVCDKYQIADEYGYKNSCRSYVNLDEPEQTILDNQDRVKVLVESQDPYASYSYDDYALLELDKYYYIFNTSGCSCPSPTETWVLVYMGTRPQLVEVLSKPADSRNYGESGWTAFRQQCAKVWPEIPPVEQGKRYDW